MKTTTKILLVLSFVAISAGAWLSISPTGQAQAASLQELIDSIKAKIAALQQQLAILEGQQNNQTTTWCYIFNRNLGFGDSGEAVANLQTALSKEGLYTQTNTSGVARFDEQTASAVVAFQQKYAAEILTPNGLSYGTGYVGASTRVKLNALYGCNNQPNTGNLVITGISGPTSLAVNTMGTWTVNTTSQGSGNLSYSVNWGDQANMMSPMANVSSTATFSHSYATAGTYTITFTVMDNQGNSTNSSLMVTVGNGNQTNMPPMAHSQTINVARNGVANITLTGSDPEGSTLTYLLVTMPMHGTLTGTAPNVTYRPNTNFSGNDSFTFRVNDGTQNSSSVGVVSIKVAGNNTNNTPPVINRIAGPVTLKVNQTGTWSVSAFDRGNNPLNYFVTWGDENQMGMGANVAPSFPITQSSTFTHPYATAGTYTVTFKVLDNMGGSTTATMNVVVTN